MKIPLRVLAMVLARDRLFLAGTPDIVSEDDPYAAFEGRKGAELWVVATEDGRKIAARPLPDVPTFDGMASSGGTLFLSTVGGSVVALSGR